MTKKEGNLLGLSPFQSVGSTGVILYSPATGVADPPTKAERRIILDTQKQILVIRNQRQKAETAAQEIALLQQQGAQEFVEVVRQLSALKAQAHGKDYQSLVEEFAQRSAQMAAQHLFGVMEVSARNIGMETARPLYREEEPEVVQVVAKPKPTLFQRLIGG